MSDWPTMMRALTFIPTRPPRASAVGERSNYEDRSTQCSQQNIVWMSGGKHPCSSYPPKQGWARLYLLQFALIALPTLFYSLCPVLLTRPLTHLSEATGTSILTLSHHTIPLLSVNTCFGASVRQGPHKWHPLPGDTLTLRNPKAVDVFDRRGDQSGCNNWAGLRHLEEKICERHWKESPWADHACDMCRKNTPVEGQDFLS